MLKLSITPLYPKMRAKVKIEGEKRPAASAGKSTKPADTSDSDDSDSSEGSLPTITATTRLTLSDRFGKMAQWSVDRSNMENMNMRITKDSSDGALKVMIEEGLVVAAEEPPRRYSYSPAPAGHFPEELATTAPTGLMSWDDVRVRYEYYKSRGYLRDLDLKVRLFFMCFFLCSPNANQSDGLFVRRRTTSNGRSGGTGTRNG